MSLKFSKEIKGLQKKGTLKNKAVCMCNGYFVR